MRSEAKELQQVQEAVANEFRGKGPRGGGGHGRIREGGGVLGPSTTALYAKLGSNLPPDYPYFRGVTSLAMKLSGPDGGLLCPHERTCGR